AIVTTRVPATRAVTVLRGGSRTARVSPRGDHLRQRLRATAHGALPRALRARACRARVPRPPQSDAFGGRAHLAVGRVRLSHPADRIRTGRRRPCDRAV